MAKSAVTDWDVAPTNNSDIAGINIAEGCPASGMNDAVRTLMAQVATWLAGANAPLAKSGGVMTGAVTAMGNGSTLFDGSGTARGIGYRAIPLTSKAANYVLALTDVGQGIATTAGVTVPTNATVPFAIGDTILIHNASTSSVTISQTSGVTLRLAGTANTGNRALAQRGLATLLKVGNDEWVAAGMGVS